MFDIAKGIYLHGSYFCNDLYLNSLLVPQSSQDWKSFITESLDGDEKYNGILRE